jgi:hypothetical protein
MCFIVFSIQSAEQGVRQLPEVQPAILTLIFRAIKKGGGLTEKLFR